MDKENFYDAIIIGAGPAGLLLGNELSKKHKVLIIEKKKLEKQQRFGPQEKNT